MQNFNTYRKGVNFLRYQPVKEKQAYIQNKLTYFLTGKPKAMTSQ